jgi:glycosyltransferase involved in cell wall biosynthesis
MRVILADPPAYTPPYDHELASALGRGGIEVELVTSHFRFGHAPEPDGYRRKVVFYPLSSRLFRRSRLRMPLRTLEHLVGIARLSRMRADVIHVQWLALPQLDARLLRLGAPSVFTAHDLLPRRTSERRELWCLLLGRFDAVVAHSDYGRGVLAELGVAEERLHVIPHPVFRSEPPRADDGRTLLSVGVIREYKGLADAIAATKRIDGARLLVVGDPAEPIEGYRRQAGNVAEWRLGWLAEEELDRALSEATVAVFPYRSRADQSGALLRALGAGVPAVAYDIGGLAEPVRRFGAGRVVPAGDVEALADGARELLEDDAALADARAGANRAREELTWGRAAASHIDLYRRITS